MMVSARIGTSACQPQVSLLKEKPAEWIQQKTFQTGKIQFILSVVFFWVSTHSCIYILYLFIQSAPFGTSKNPFSRSALKAQISERIAFLALADADHLQQSFSSAGAGIQGRQSNWEAAFRNEFLVKIGLHHVTSILVCSHTAPYYIPGILC